MAGDHTPVVQLHLRYGMILFIASEVMFFVAWFWAFFDALALSPIERSTARSAARLAARRACDVLDPFGFPLLNTLILLCSGTTVTWAHHALIHGDRDGLKKGLWCTILLGLLFTSIQAYEYIHAPFAFKGNIYGSTFFMATGFHGFHVIVGTIFLIVCLVRAYKGDFTPKQHFGFEAAAWYWHFVDVVWLFLFVSIYVWGGWGAPIARLMSEAPPAGAAPSLAAATSRGSVPRCGARTLFAGLARFAPNAAPAGSISPASTSATGRRRS